MIQQQKATEQSIKLKKGSKMTDKLISSHVSDGLKVESPITASFCMEPSKSR